MALSPEIEAQILRYYHAERWRIGTIATQLQVHRDSDMVKSRGYPGRPDHFRHLIARHRPRPKAEAYLGSPQKTENKAR